MKAPHETAAVTITVRVLAESCGDSGIEFVCGWDKDAGHADVTFYWVIGGNDNDRTKVKPGEREFLNSSQDIDGVKRFLRGCLQALELLEEQMEALA